MPNDQHILIAGIGLAATLWAGPKGHIVPYPLGAAALSLKQFMAQGACMAMEEAVCPAHESRREVSLAGSAVSRELAR